MGNGTSGLGTKFNYDDDGTHVYLCLKFGKMTHCQNSKYTRFLCTRDPKITWGEFRFIKECDLVKLLNGVTPSPVLPRQSEG